MCNHRFNDQPPVWSMEGHVREPGTVQSQSDSTLRLKGLGLAVREFQRSSSQVEQQTVQKDIHPEDGCSWTRKGCTHFLQREAPAVQRHENRSGLRENTPSFSKRGWDVGVWQRDARHHPVKASIEEGKLLGLAA